MAGVCTGDGPCVTVPIGPGPNWVTKVSGLPLYIRAVARALLRAGHSEQDAVRLAVGVVRRWASGEGNVTPATRARAAKALAEWEAKKAAVHEAGRRDGEFGGAAVTESGSAGSLLPIGPTPRQAKAVVARERRPDRPHAFRGSDLGRCALCGRAAVDPVHSRPFVNGRRHYDPAEPRDRRGEWTRIIEELAQVARHPGSGVSVHARTGTAPRRGYMVAERGRSFIADPAELVTREARDDFLFSFLRHAGDSFDDPEKYVGVWHDPEHSEIVLDPADNIIDRDEAVREGAARNQQSIYDVEQDDVVDTGGTGDRDSAVRWRPQASAGGEEDLRDDRRGAAPVRPRPRRPAGAAGEEAVRIPRQASRCLGAALVADLLGTAGVRHAGPGHAPVVTGHVKGNRHRRRQDAKAVFDRDADAVEPKVHAALLKLFDRQRRATLSRLRGNRGKRMVRSAQPPAVGGEPPQHPANRPPGATSSGAPVPPDPSAIFDAVFWAAETAEAMGEIYDLVAELSVRRVRAQLGDEEHVAASEPVASSLASVTSILDARADRLAGQVTDTTFRQIAGQLADGLSEGENIAQLADRVEQVFDEASRTRALLIARTETIGALNEAANAYAESRGPDVVWRKEWLAHHDTRTRPTHRVADGQRVPLGQPFFVGGWPMQHPGDPTAPPSEVCNCRCSVAYLPAEHALDLGAAA